jgi:hypothetical protein
MPSLFRTAFAFHLTAHQVVAKHEAEPRHLGHHLHHHSHHPAGH